MERLNKFLVLCNVYSLILVVTSAVDFKITNVQCKAVNQSLGEFKMCSLKAIKRNVVELNVNFSPSMNPLDNITLIFRLNKRGHYAQKALYEFKVDVCAFLSSTRRNPLADLVYNMFELKKYSNMNHSCPYDHDVILSHCRVNTNIFNVLPFTSGEYTMYSKWILLTKHAADINVSFKLD